MKLAKQLINIIFNRRSSVGAVSQTAIANLVIQAANVLCGLISARILGPAGRGEMAGILLWPQFFAYLLTLGIPVASIYHIKRNPESASAFAAIALLVSLIMGIIGSLLGFFFIPLSLHTYSASAIHSAQLLVLASPLALCGLTLSIQVQSAESFRLYNLFRIAPPMLILLALFAEAAFGKLTSFNGALAYMLAGFPILIWNFIWVWKHFKPNLKGSFKPARMLFSYGLRVWGSDLLGAVASQVDRVLVVAILNPADVGLYVVAQSAAALLNVIPAAMLAVLLPKASNRTTVEIAEMVGRASRLTAAGMLICGSPLLFAGKFALELVYGPRFAGASTVLGILVIEGVLDGTAAVLTQAFLAAGSPGTVTILQLCGLATAIPLLAALGPKWGLLGAAVAMLISTSLRLIFVWRSFPLRLHMAPPGLILRHDDFSFAFKKNANREPIAI